MGRRALDRRTFIAGIGAVLAAPRTAGAQQSRKVYRIGALTLVSAPAIEDAFRQGLKDRGYIEARISSSSGVGPKESQNVFPSWRPNWLPAVWTLLSRHRTTQPERRRPQPLRFPS